MVESRDASRERVVFQVEDVESPEIQKRRWNVAGDVVLRQDNDFDAVEQRDRGGELAGEIVVVKENRFEVDQGGEVRDLAGE